MKINNRIISTSSETYFIADLAANHDGSLDRAKRLIELAANAGADAVKFQHFRAEYIVSDMGFRNLGKLDHHSNWERSVFEVYKAASLDWAWTPELARVASDNGVDFFTSPYDFEAVDHVDEFVPAYKIGSGDIDWLEMLKHIASKGKPVIIASGASSMHDVRAAVEALRAENADFCLMQCNTNYTGDARNLRYVNLNVLTSFQREFPDVLLGLSDHTHGHVSVLGAVALGARMVEKHFTDDIYRIGPDHGFSMSPTTWREMVDATRSLESALGDGIKRVEENELSTAQIQRRGVRFASDLPAGHVISREDLIPLRPLEPGGIPVSMIASLLGREVAYDVSVDQAVLPECLI
jgi:sialic acid synthase SpsE